MTKAIILTCALFLIASNIRAQIESSDKDINMSLDSVIVHGHLFGDELRINQKGSFNWEMESIKSLPKILGNSDPWHYSQMLPGISTNGEYDSGLRVLGCENEHNYVSINGIPVYGATHLFGFFSIFNPLHYRQMQIKKSISEANMPNRLGAVINMQPDSSPTDSIKGCAEIGMISSQGTLKIPIGRNGKLITSFRTSYMNLLYSKLMKSDDSSVKYAFYDVNISYEANLNECHRFYVDTYIGQDDAKMQLYDNIANLDLKWSNEMFGGGWQYCKNEINLDQRIFFSRYHSKGNLAMSEIDVEMPSAIINAGYCGKLTWKDLKFGYDFNYYKVEPQVVHYSSTYKQTEDNLVSPHYFENSIYIDYNKNINDKITVQAGIRGSIYSTNSDTYTNLSPSASITYMPSELWTFHFNYSLRHQYLFQTGMSTMNTPLEFWASAGSYGLKPQSSNGFLINTKYTTPNGEYCFYVEPYIKWLTNQVEFDGNIYSFLASDYNLNNMFLIGNGCNYGSNITLLKAKGKITGWISYAYSKSMRTFHTSVLEGTFPSSHQRLHEIDAVVNYKLNNKISFGITGVFASGNPFTAPKSVMIYESHIVAQYAEHNSNRLPAYYRIDCSVDYKFAKTKKTEQSLNLSVYNATAHHNSLFYYLHISNNSYRYKPMAFALSILPSISYSIKF